MVKVTDLQEGCIGIRPPKTGPANQQRSRTNGLQNQYSGLITDNKLVITGYIQKILAMIDTISYKLKVRKDL